MVTHNPAEALLPCPFCGPGQSHVDLWHDDVSKRWRVGCGRCGCSTGISPRDKTEAPAIAAWNKRAIEARDWKKNPPTAHELSVQEVVLDNPWIVNAEIIDGIVTRYLAARARIDGAKMMPREATAEMLEAAHRAKIFLNMTNEGWRRAYRAMLSALIEETVR